MIYINFVMILLELCSACPPFIMCSGYALAAIAIRVITGVLKETTLGNSIINDNDNTFILSTIFELMYNSS